MEMEEKVKIIRKEREVREISKKVRERMNGRMEER